MPIVALLVAATVYVVGLKSIGLISALQNVMTGMNSNGLGFVLPLILVVLCGYRTSFAKVQPYSLQWFPLSILHLLQAFAIAVAVPMGLAGNLLRAVSPVSAVIIIVSGSIKETQ